MSFFSGDEELYGIGILFTLSRIVKAEPYPSYNPWPTSQSWGTDILKANLMNPGAYAIRI